MEPSQRYGRQRPGELIHIDVKELGRISTAGAGHRMTGRPSSRRQAIKTDAAGVRRGTAGWDAVHVAINDATSLTTPPGRLRRPPRGSDFNRRRGSFFTRRRHTIAFYERHGITVQRLLTDNGSPYRSSVHAIACRALGIRHLRTRPYRPQTNGKAERFIRTQCSSAGPKGAIYDSTTERTAALDGCLYHYDHHRPHSAVGQQPSVNRLNNLLGTYT